jgi:hypothetical protein
MRSFVHVITAQTQEHAGPKHSVRESTKRPHAARGFLGLRRG